MSELEASNSYCRVIFPSHLKKFRVEFIKRQAHETTHAFSTIGISLASLYISNDINEATSSLICGN